jgi:hypothetical protein
MPIQVAAGYGPVTKKVKVPALGASAATKAALLPSLEGSVGLPGVPRSAAPTSLVPQVSIPKATSVVAPKTGLQSYMSELTGDLNYQSAEQAYNNALEMGQRSLLADPFKQALNTYGYDISGYLQSHPGSVPQNIADLANKYLDPASVAAARANPYSTANQIGKSFDEALAGVPGQLAERGLLGSGGSAITASKLDYGRGLADKQAMDEFLGSLGTANQNYLDFASGQRSQFEDAKAEVANRLAQQQGYSADLDAQGNAVTAPPAAPAPVTYKLAPKTQALIKKMKTSGQVSAWEKAMAKLTGGTR